MKEPLGLGVIKVYEESVRSTFERKQGILPKWASLARGSLTAFSEKALRDSDTITG